MDSLNLTRTTHSITRIGLLVIALTAASVPIAAQSVTLQSAASPSSGTPGTSASVTGGGFPGGTIQISGVQISMTPVTAGAGPNITPTATSVTLVTGTTRRVSFQIPSPLAITAPVPYKI